MTSTLALSSRIYGRLLSLYPEELRRDFGEEMALAFADDLAMAQHDAGLRGVLRVWRGALWEFFKFALPGQASNPVVRVPAIGLAFSVFSLSAELALHYSIHVPLRFAFAATLPTFATVLTPLAVMWACRGKDVVSLHLSDQPRGDR